VNNRVNYENQDKKKFEGITKLKNNYRKITNSTSAKEDNNNNGNANENSGNNNSRINYNAQLVNTSYVNSIYKCRNTPQNNEKVSKSFYENNSNLKDRSLSPITHKKNQYVDEFVNVKIAGTDMKDTTKNLSYFEEFNVFN